MPLSNTTLHTELCAQPDTSDAASAAQAWGVSLSKYIAESVPGLANPAAMDSLMQSTVVAALSSLVPLTFVFTLQSSLILFWTQFIPVAIPGQAAVLALPTLAPLLTPAMVVALGCNNRASAMTPISEVIHAWTLSIFYGTPVTGPVTPLV